MSLTCLPKRLVWPGSFHRAGIVPAHAPGRLARESGRIRTSINPRGCERRRLRTRGNSP
jgi:hypothetical protein